MGFLKYLDILIGLAVVMVLLSPLVTALTQALMLLFDFRAHFLSDALGKIITGLGGFTLKDYRAEVTVTGGPNSAPGVGVNVGLGGGGATQQTDQQGVAKFEDLSTLGDVESVNVTLTQGNAAFVADGVKLTLISKNLPTPAPAPAVPTGGIAAAPALPAPMKPAAIAIEWPTTRQARAANANSETWTATRPPLLEKDHSWQLADAVLRHPRIAKGIGARRGDVIERGELTRVLLELAAGQVDFKVDRPDNLWTKFGLKTWNWICNSKFYKLVFGDKRRMAWGVDFALPSAAVDRLKNVLALNGVANPAQKLVDIRDKMQDQEMAHPEPPTHQVDTAAIIQAGKNAFVAKINEAFDPAMTRVTQRYAFRARLVTVAGAFVVIALLQLDTFHLLNRLSADDTFRTGLVTEAANQEKIIEAAKPTDQKDQNLADQARTRMKEINRELDTLRKPEMSIIPDHFFWEKDSPPISSLPLGGMVLSWVLLSLGAPFWYDALKDLLKLRPALAPKADQQAQARAADNTKTEAKKNP